MLDGMRGVANDPVALTGLGDDLHQSNGALHRHRVRLKCRFHGDDSLHQIGIELLQFRVLLDKRLEPSGVRLIHYTMKYW